MAALATFSSNNKNLGLAQYLFTANTKRIPYALKYGGTYISWDDALAPYTGRNMTKAETKLDGMDKTLANRIGNKILEYPGDTVPRLDDEAIRSYALNAGQHDQLNEEKKGVTSNAELVSEGSGSVTWGVRLSNVVKPADCLLMSERNQRYGGVCYNRAGAANATALGSITLAASGGIAALGQWGNNDGLGNHGKGKDYKVCIFIDQHVEYVTAQSVWDSRLHWSGDALWSSAKTGN